MSKFYPETTDYLFASHYIPEIADLDKENVLAIARYLDSNDADQQQAILSLLIDEPVVDDSLVTLARALAIKGINERVRLNAIGYLIEIYRSSKNIDIISFCVHFFRAANLPSDVYRALYRLLIYVHMTDPTPEDLRINSNDDANKIIDNIAFIYDIRD